MSMKIVDEGAASIANVYGSGLSAPTSWTLRLFTDNATLDDADQVSDRTAATGGNYGDKTLDPVGGASPATISTVSGIVQIAWPEQTFDFDGPLNTNPTIYGYMIFDNSGTLIVEELLSEPFTPSQIGDNIKITPIIKLGNGNPN